jgi:serine protease inhibitor
MEGAMLRRKHERKVGALGAFSPVILLTAGCGGGSGGSSGSTPVNPGAVGTTQQAMAQTLRLGDLSVPQLNGGNAALQASLPDQDPKVDLTIANSLWVHLSAHPVAPAFVSPGAFISDVEHKTVVEVNETGTVAADATSVGISISAMQDPVNLTVNHPFFYGFLDNTTGDLRFVGVLMNPRAG